MATINGLNYRDARANINGGVAVIFFDNLADWFNLSNICLEIVK
jgi:hypothetical protein